MSPHVLDQFSLAILHVSEGIDPQRTSILGHAPHLKQRLIPNPRLVSASQNQIASSELHKPAEHNCNARTEEEANTLAVRWNKRACSLQPSPIAKKWHGEHSCVVLSSCVVRSSVVLLPCRAASIGAPAATALKPSKQECHTLLLQASHPHPKP